MFDVGFLELLVIMVLGLLVLGPERLPKAAQKVGYWFGKARRYVEGMKSQVEAEFDSTEVKRLLHNQEVQIRELQSKITDTDDFINSEYHNQFDDKEDPGTSPEPIDIEEEIKPTGPKYDILEEENAHWDEEEELKSSEKVASNKTQSAESAMNDSAMSDKAQ